MTTLAYQDPAVSLYLGDCREAASVLPTGSVQAIVTSPPYWGLRDQEFPGSIGDEGLVQDYVGALVSVFAVLAPLLHPRGSLFLNLGDSYYNQRTGHKGGTPPNTIHAGKQNGRPSKARGCARRATKQTLLKEKDLAGVPWRVALALQDDGWYLRNEIIWHKPNPMPEKVETLDRFPRNHEHVFLLTRSLHYEFKNVERLRTVWLIQQRPVQGHNSTFPIQLAERCARAVTRPGDLIMDPFCGSGQTLLAARRTGRRAVGFEISTEACALATARVKQQAAAPTLDFFED